MIEEIVLDSSEGEESVFRSSFPSTPLPAIEGEVNCVEFDLIVVQEIENTYLLW